MVRSKGHKRNSPNSSRSKEDAKFVKQSAIEEEPMEEARETIRGKLQNDTLLSSKKGIDSVRKAYESNNTIGSTKKSVTIE